MNSKTGVLLVNLGTPDSPTPQDLRKYLKEFLSDPYVVDYPRWLWYPILYGIILRTRPKKSAKLYQEIWTENGSPLLVYTQGIAAKLKDQTKVSVAVGMTYGNPKISAALDKLKDCEKLVVIPMFPQYSLTTSETALQKVKNEIQNTINHEDVIYISSYHLEEAYIQGLAKSIRESFEKNGEPDQLIFSYHGIPKRYVVKKGDVYANHCAETTLAVAEKLGLPKNKWMMCFQSRFGPETWLKPYLDKTLEELPGRDVKNVQVICPGFSVDCLETLEEVAIQNREIFLKAGGESYHYIPCLNESKEHAQVFQNIIESNS